MAAISKIDQLTIGHQKLLKLFHRSLLEGSEFQEVLMEIGVAIFDESNLVHGMSYVLVNQVT